MDRKTEEMHRSSPPSARSTVRAGRRPTLSDIAEAAGATKMTASRALNGRPGVSDEMREKIRQLAHEMGYVSNWMAKTLTARRSDAESGIIGVIAEIHTPFMAEVVEAIGAILRQSDRDMLVYSRPEPGKAIQRNVRDLLLHAVDGVIAVLPRDTDDLSEFSNARVPIVAIDRYADDVTVPSVASDSYAGARMAMQHLIELGHKRIAFLGGEEGRFSAQERLRGYRDAMSETGFQIDDADILDAGYLQERGQEATMRLLSRTDRPTAIFAANDVSALGAMAAADTLGLVVPEDVSVIGFDDIPAAGQVRPGLTTIRQSYADIGVAAVALLDQVAAGERDGDRQVVIPVEIVVRGTTARIGHP